ncbi:MAG TPA: efflux RND transporter permease subunit, partial [Bacteroidales bacterium]
QREQRGLFLTGGKQAVTMAIIQQSDAKVSELKKAVNNILESLRNEYPRMDFEISRDQTSLLDFSISNLRQDLIMGCIMAFLLLFLFMNDFKASMLIGITVPISLVVSFLFFNLIGLSINIISIAGLGLGLGMIIDCSIIVIENITYYRHQGLSVFDACKRGTNEVIRPMLSSTLTTSAVFLPLIFMSGLAGALFFDEAVSVSIGNGASFIVAITILPVLFALFYKPRKKTINTENKKSFKKLPWLKKSFHLKKNGTPFYEEQYEKGVSWVFKHKMATLLMFLVLLLSGVLWYSLVRKEKFPTFKQDEMVVDIDWNENIHIDENRGRVAKLINTISQLLKQSNCQIGEQQFVLKQEKDLDYFEAEIYLKLKNADDLAWVRDTLEKEISTKYPLAHVSFRPPTNIFEQIFSNNDPPLLAMISMKDAIGFDTDSLLHFVALSDSVLQQPGANKIPVKMHLSISVDQEKLLLYNVSFDAVIEAINTSFNDNKITTLRSFQQFLPVMLGDNPQTISSALNEKKVKNSNGEELPLTNFITVKKDFDLKYITAGKQGVYIPLQYNAGASDIGKYQETIRKVASLQGYQDVSFSGSILKNKAMYAQLAIILIISVLLLYFILAAQF